MSKTNAQVIEAFHKGKEAHNSRATLESLQPIADGLTILQSYRTTIAIRRGSDDQEFWDGHSYSNTTSAHQRGPYSNPTFSFSVVAELMGSRWWETAHIQDWGPRTCSNPLCQERRDSEYAAYLRNETKYRDDMFSKCHGLGDPQDRHEVNIPGYGDGRHGGFARGVLLSFGHDRQVLCGFESGKAVKWMGRTDLLWAAILPFRVRDIVQAFEALKPSYVRNAERHNKDQEEAGQPTWAIKRQGDLYFVECPNGQGPPKGAFKLDGVTLPPGERANHRASKVRMICGPEGTHSFDDAGWRIWARGNVDHPEHARLRLGGWHRVLQSAALRAASSPYRHPMGRGGVGAD